MKNLGILYTLQIYNQDHLNRFALIPVFRRIGRQHENVRISGFCDMLINSGLPEEEKLWRWLERQKKQQKAEHHLWLMHFALFIDDPNEPNFDITKPEQYYEWYFGIDEPGRSRLMEIFRSTGATHVITGHIHCRKDYLVNNIHFNLAPGVAGSQWADKWPDGNASLGFSRYDVDGPKMEKTFIALEKESNASGKYGLGGHPPIEQRDYSLATDKE